MDLYQERADLIHAAQYGDPFNNHLTRRVFQTIPRPCPLRLLEIGCGAGRNLLEAARRGMAVVGIDVNAGALQIARESASREGLLSQITLIQADPLQWRPDPEETFDYVLLVEVIEHVAAYEDLIQLAYRCLKTGGRLHLTTPNDPGQWTLMDDFSHHLRRFTPAEIQKLLSPFNEVRIQSVGFPFHRCLRWTYHELLKAFHVRHRAENMFGTSWKQKLYYGLGYLSTCLDAPWNTPWGTTLVCSAKK